jgi:hypothetical protein
MGTNISREPLVPAYPENVFSSITVPEGHPVLIYHHQRYKPHLKSYPIMEDNLRARNHNLMKYRK